MTSHDQNVLRQFDPRAAAYLSSAVHAAGPDLNAARRLVETTMPRNLQMLDAGCGAGHLGFALAPLVGGVTACDPSPAMLATTAAAARDRGLGNLRCVPAPVEALPFADASFDLVASRYSAHHWFDVPAALRELRRVARPAAFLLIIDVLGDACPVADTHLQAMELLRDPGHVRNHTARQWRSMIEAAGFGLQHEASWKLRLAFDAWITRMGTPAPVVATIRTLQQGAPEEVRARLALEDDGSFSPSVGLFVARL